MAYKIIVGRDREDRKKFGEEGVIFLGRHYVKMGQTTSLSNEVFMDIVRNHIVLISGKRGSGKSYSLGVIAEELSNLPKEVANNVSVLIFDTMGIFWTMKYKNEKDRKLLDEWKLKGKGLNVNIYVPSGYFEKSKELGFPADLPFSIKPSELSADDWVLTFGLSKSDDVSVLIEKILYEFKEKGIEEYGISDIIKAIENDKESNVRVKNDAKNKFKAALGWGLFEKFGTAIKSITKGGEVSILDISSYGDKENVKALVIGLVTRRLFTERMAERKKEELEDISGGRLSDSKKEREMPLVWLIIDESHFVLPDKGKTAATDALVTVLREGRQPGISLVLATQQPGKIHNDVITQSDLVISHRLTAKQDIAALNSMMQSYVTEDLIMQLNNLPREKGSGIILDDNSERIYPMRVRPRFTWHGGESPTVIREKKKLFG